MFSCYEIVQLCRDTFPTCHFAILCSRHKQHTQPPGWGTFSAPGASNTHTIPWLGNVYHSRRLCVSAVM